jgi:hypothetical protein
METENKLESRSGKMAKGKKIRIFSKTDFDGEVCC